MSHIFPLRDSVRVNFPPRAPQHSGCSHSMNPHDAVEKKIQNRVKTQSALLREKRKEWLIYM